MVSMPAPDWTSVQDDQCRWILDLPGGPLPVLPCCHTPAKIERRGYSYRVGCPVCGRQTPALVHGGLLDVLKLWNEMVE